MPRTAFTRTCESTRVGCGAMSLGKGVIYGTSTRQKLNTKSSTEAELVGMSDVLPQALWTCYFMEAQGHNIEDSLLHQDNESTMRLENNGCGSSGKRTRHINIQYFFITVHIQNKEVRDIYCPTGDMVADYFTKPLQGVQFCRLRDMIMNVPESIGPVSTASILPGPQECVGTDGQTVDADASFTLVPVTKKRNKLKKKEI